jgi:hypothetical protein
MHISTFEKMFIALAPFRQPFMDKQPTRGFAPTSTADQRVG